MSAEQAQEIAQQTLQGLWTYLTGSSSRWRDHLVAESRPRVGVAWRLNYRFWEWVPVDGTDVPVYRCDHCANISYINLDDLCPFYGCAGRLLRMAAGDGAWDDNHYRHLYQTLEPISVTAEEHTASGSPMRPARCRIASFAGRSTCSVARPPSSWVWTWVTCRRY